MESFNASVMKLVGLAGFLEEQGNFDDSLNEMAALAANLLDSENCSLMLFHDEGEDGPVMRIYASHGYLPAAAYTEKARHKEGIAGQVAATGQALLIPDIEQSSFAPKARWPERRHKGFVSAPIFIARKVVGVINVNSPVDDRTFGEKDLYQLTTVALVVGKSIQVRQLQNLLRSRFAQLAVLNEANAVVEDAVGAALKNPAFLAKSFGRAFYRELRKAGFSNNHIINAATEVIAQLSERVERHRGRGEEED